MTGIAPLLLVLASAAQGSDACPLEHGDPVVVRMTTVTVGSESYPVRGPANREALSDVLFACRMVDSIDAVDRWRRDRQVTNALAPVGAVVAVAAPPLGLFGLVPPAATAVSAGTKKRELKETLERELPHPAPETEELPASTPSVADSAPSPDAVAGWRAEAEREMRAKERKRGHALVVTGAGGLALGTAVLVDAHANRHRDDPWCQADPLACPVEPMTYLPGIAAVGLGLGLGTLGVEMIVSADEQQAGVQLQGRF